MKFLVLLFVAAAFAEPEAEPEADPYLLYGGYYNGLHGGYYNGFSRYYNGLHPVYKTIVPATVEKTEEAVVEKSGEPVKKVLSYPLHYPYGRLHYSTGYPAYTYGGYGYPYTYGAYRTPFTAFAPTAAAEKPAEERKKREADPEADAEAYYGYGYGHGVYGAYGYGGYAGYPYHTGYAGYRYGGYPYHTVKYVVKPAEAEAKSDEAVEEVKKVVPFSSYYYPHHFGYNYGRYYY